MPGPLRLSAEPPRSCYKRIQARHGLSVHASACASLARLSVKPTIGPCSRAASGSRRSAAKSGTPSYYELMDLADPMLNRRALERAMQTARADAGRREQLEPKLKHEPWEEVAMSRPTAASAMR
jgi:hypothetical protein